MLIGWQEVGTDAPKPGTLGMSTLACHSNGLGQNLGEFSLPSQLGAKSQNLK